MFFDGQRPKMPCIKSTARWQVGWQIVAIKAGRREQLRRENRNEAERSENAEDDQIGERRREDAKDAANVESAQRDRALGEQAGSNEKPAEPEEDVDAELSREGRATRW